jgi:hypothetical protein
MLRDDEFGLATLFAQAEDAANGKDDPEDDDSK